MKKISFIVVAMIFTVGVMAGPHHGHGPHHHYRGRPGYCGRPGYYGYRNDGLALAAGICNIVGGVIAYSRPTYVAAPVYATPVYTTPTVVTPTPTIYYNNGYPVGSVQVINDTQTRTQVVHYNTYHIEQTVSTGGTGTIIMSR